MPEKDSQFKSDDRFLIGAAMGIGIVLLLALTLMGERALPDGAVGLALGALFLFDVMSVGLRWFVTKNGRRIYLIGRYPLLLGAIRFACFVAFVSLMLLALAGLFVGGDFKEFALGAFVRGMVAAAGVTLFVGGLMNALIIVRHFRGTLAATSREGR